MGTINSAVTLDINGAKITVETHELFRAWFDKHISATPPATSIPELNAGEQYAGIIFGKDGAPNHHLILLPKEDEEANWQQALDFAKSVGGELPTRREQSLLFTNLKEQFKPNWYWSGEQHSGISGYAWDQTFSYGSQYGYHKDGCFRARAVRRLVIF